MFFICAAFIISITEDILLYHLSVIVKEKNSLMMLEKLRLAFSIFVFLLINITPTKADLKIPNNLILPAEVIKIQLIGLMENDKDFKDSGIEQTWNFAHPDNKKLRDLYQILR